MRISLSSLFLFLSLGSAAAASDPHLESVKEIFAWVNGAKDGFVTSKQSVRRMVENDLGTPLMVYATEDIQKGELLVQTPWSHILKSDNQRADDQTGWHCGTVYKLKEEIQKGKDSFYAPYTTYVNDEPEGQLAARYSKKAQKLLLQLIGTHPDEVNRSPVFSRDDAPDHRLMPADMVAMMDHNWYGVCEGKRSDKLAAKAAELLMLRADDHILIPAYDAYNHRNNDKHNGKDYMNAMTETTNGKYHQTFAQRDIQKGEQIFISYNMCEQCQARSHSGFGTAEMFREYGFVEWFPQRWHYPGFGDWDPEENELELNQFDLYQNEDTKDLTIVWTHLSKDDDKLERFKVFLSREIRRLKRLKNIEWADMYSWTEDQWKKSGISSREWSSINQFLDANIVAMTIAVEDLTTDAPRPLTVSQDGLEKLLNGGSHYDALSEPEKDDLPYYKYTCDSSEFFEFLGFIDTENAFWTDREQLLGYFESYFFNQKNEGVEDVNACYDVMNTVQMCSSFRAYHHEYMTHIPARYIESLKRVAFVGNGDSMMLHEIMKYPDIELVVGLELDQTVTRKAFKHYKTDPYFHDPRVDWWFGDATKSVLVLPESYWGSFDLVLVDLGQRTLDTNVTEDLSLFESLTRLVNPDTGIMVRNDLGLDTVSGAFDHSMQLFYEMPAICSEAVAIGSNGIDFVDAPIYDHGVADMGNLLYTLSPEEAGERHELVHDYRSKSCQMQETDTVTSEVEEEQTKANGVIEFLSLEHLKTPPDSFESITTSLKTVIEGVDGFSILENGVFFDDDEKLALIIMEEGYVAARMQHDEEAVENAENAFYLGFDVYLWSQMHRSQELKNSILKAFESEEVSSYKLVTGGLFGAKSWKDDAKRVGPTVSSLPTKTCVDKDTSTIGDFDAEGAGEIVVEEVLSLTNSQNLVVAVVCGSENDSCTSLNVLKNQKLVKEVVPIYDCASSTEDLESLYGCEHDIIQDLSSKLDSRKKLHMLVLDSSASQQMHQIVNSIFETYENREAFLRWHNVFVSWSSKNAASSAEPWRKEFLDRYRKQIHHDPVKMGDFDIVSGGDSYTFGVVSTNDSGAAQKMGAFQQSLQNRLPDGTLVALRNMYGGLFKYKDPSQHKPKEFFAREYDQSAGEEHFEKQVPLAVQTVLQYEGNDAMKEQASRGIGMECNFAEKLVYGSTMKEGLLEDPSKQTLFQYTVGDGCVVLMIGKAFNAISVWDGKVNLDLNFFAVSTGEKTPSAAYVDMALREFAPFVNVATDAQPRGLGSIVNMAEDLVSIDRASIAANLGQEDYEENPFY